MLPPGGDIKTICQGLRWPVAVKANPDDADHKTEKGLLSLNVADEAGVAAEAARLRGARAQRRRADGARHGHRRRRSACCRSAATRISARCCRSAAAACLVELFQDLVQLAAPVDNEAVHRALQRLKLSRLLAGFRGKPAADVDALVDAAVRLTHAFQARADLKEIELNPVLVLPKGQGIVAVDLLIKNG